MKCCGRTMIRVDVLTHWCCNCGAIRSRWMGRGRIGPNLYVCATCKSWGPDGMGATRRCHNDENANHHTSWGDIARALHVSLATVQKARRDVDGKQRVYKRKVKGA